MDLRLHPFAAPLLAAGLLSAAPVEFTPLVSLGNNVECVKCQGYLLPGRLVPREFVPYAIHSDLPEIFESDGVLYATFPVLPPFDTHKDGPLPEVMRTQVNHGFMGIDGSFEVFIYHLSVPGGGTAPRRIVVYAKNRGATPTSIVPHSAIEGKGKMATEDGPEILLARRVFTGDFDTGEAVTIPPGAGAVLTATPVIAADQDDINAAFINGIVRGMVTSPDKPLLDIAIVAIPGHTPEADWTRAAEALLGNGAKSGEYGMDLRIPPPDCHLRRVVGVYRNFEWHGAATIDVSNLPDGNLAFQMALPAAQAMECESARQTNDMLLHPPYVRPETIGNYTIEYRVELDLHNLSVETVPVDVRFGKQDASVALVWTATVGEDATPGPVRSGWAGAWTKVGDLPDNTRSFLESYLVLEPGDQQKVILDFHIVGTSSLPFQVHVIREEAGKKEEARAPGEP